MASKRDAALYGVQPPRKLQGKREISSSQSLSFTSQLSSLINDSSASSISASTGRRRHKKDDIFTQHNRNTAKRAKRDLEAHDAFTRQKHTTHGEALDGALLERSRRKLEDKARLYAAMKRGDIEDDDERYAVDFDRKWAETHPEGADASSSSSDEDKEDAGELIEYMDEFGRTRQGTRRQAARTERSKRIEAEFAANGSGSAARPAMPTNVIRGDTIQYGAFDPDEPIAAQMARLAAKRDRSDSPPPDVHFDASKEARQKGTGFFQFSLDEEERRREMEALQRERDETDRRRKEREERLAARQMEIEERRRRVALEREQKKAENFLNELGLELSGHGQDHGRSGGLAKEDLEVTKIDGGTDAPRNHGSIDSDGGSNGPENNVRSDADGGTKVPEDHQRAHAAAITDAHKEQEGEQELPGGGLKERARELDAMEKLEAAGFTG